MSKNKNVNIRVLGDKGQELNANMFKQEIKKSDLDNPDLIEIFNKYNKNGDDKLDQNEMQSLFSDLQTSSQNVDTTKNRTSLKRSEIIGTGSEQIFDKIDSASVKKDSVLTGSQIKDFYTKVQAKNRTLEPAEIKKLIQSKGLSKKVKVCDVLNFLDKIETNAHVKRLNKFSLDKNTQKELSSIKPQNVADVLTSYKKENGESIIQHIANRRWTFGDKREKFINIVKNKLISQAKIYGIDTKKFSTQFDAELKKLDLTFMMTEDTSKLDALVDGVVTQIKAKQDNYKANRNSIASIMSNPDECRTGDDKYDLINRIIQISNQNNPQKLISDIIAETKDPTIKKNAQMLSKSKIITDYFPTFIASIIAQESQFRGTDNQVFTANGQGMMQLTMDGIKGIYESPDKYDPAFVKEITNKYPTVNALYDAIKNKRDADLNMKVGSRMLAAHIKEILRQISQHKLPSAINIDSPEVIMQLVARAYNGNPDPKADKKNNNKLSKVKDVYSRDVIQRMHDHAPKDANIKKYYEYNPDTKKYSNKKFPS